MMKMFCNEVSKIPKRKIAGWAAFVLILINLLSIPIVFRITELCLSLLLVICLAMMIKEIVIVGFLRSLMGAGRIDSCSIKNT